MLKQLAVLSALLAASACGQAEHKSSPAHETPETDAAEAPSETADASPRSLDQILADLPDDAKARIPYRHPKETLEFFGVAPGMTVVDTTPGDIWYAGILAEYLGPEGKVIGADRPLAVWESFGTEYAPPEFLAARPAWTESWPEEQAERFGSDAASFDAIAYGRVPAEMAGTADVVMIIREFHNIMGADETNALIAGTLEEIHMLLKPGGVFGIVQHRAQEDASDEWANGSNGYIKQSAVVALAEAAGFTLEETSDVNANAKDQPTEDDYVWRLPPALDVPEEDNARREAMLAIGESDRMTLKFRKSE